MPQIPASYRRLEGSEQQPAHDARRVGPVGQDESITVTLCVRQRPGAPPLPDHAHWMATPPGKRKFLSTEEFAAKHGAAQEDIDAIARFAQTGDFRWQKPAFRGEPSPCQERSRR